MFISAIRSGPGTVPDVPGLHVDLSQIGPGQLEIVNWQSRPVLIYRRTDADIVSLRTPDARLLDAASLNSDQPENFANDFRAQLPDWFVAIAVGTGKGCVVELLTESAETFQQQPWTGGFKESCGEDRYDLSGRVYQAQYATRNLAVPTYTIADNTLILGRSQ